MDSAPAASTIMYEPTPTQAPTGAEPVIAPQAIPDSSEGNVIVPQADGAYNILKPLVDPGAFVISGR